MITGIYAVLKVSPVILLLFLFGGCSERSLKEERYWSRTYGAAGSYSVQDIGNAGEGFIISGYLTSREAGGAMISSRP